MPHAYEGYLEKGQIYTTTPLIKSQGRRRVIITVLDEPILEKTNTWTELDKIIAEMSEKPRLEDFRRSQLDRKLINFEEV